jgi:hypothetical protein
MGIRRIAVVFDGIAVAATNRPTVWEGYEELFSQLPDINVSGHIDVNEKDISRSCKEITSFDPEALT